ncbi:MAG: hypothetical protein Kow00121_09820 [Elainellaceae cyanobacterium]
MIVEGALSHYQPLLQLKYRHDIDEILLGIMGMGEGAVQTLASDGTTVTRFAPIHRLEPNG